MALASLPSHPLLQTLPLQIAEHIGARIVDGTHAPGSRLREVELAASFEVSRATVREALRLLEQRGLVRILPQRGAHVTQLSVQELHDLFEVRTSLLATGSRLVAERRNADDARRLRGMLDELRQAVPDVDAYTRISAELVRTLAELSGNEVLAGYIGDFAMRIGRYTRMGLATLADRRRSLATWEQLIAAIERGDGAAAAAHHARLALDNRGAALEEFRRQSQAQQPAPSRPLRVVRDGH
jgi:DNA-binding GntR family transcriptional regulator